MDPIASQIRADLPAKNRQLLWIGLGLFPLFALTDWMLAPAAFRWTGPLRLAFVLYAVAALRALPRLGARWQLPLLYLTCLLVSVASAAIMWLNRDLSATTILILVPLVVAMMVPLELGHCLGLFGMIFAVCFAAPFALIFPVYPDRSLAIAGFASGALVFLLASANSHATWRAKLRHARTAQELGRAHRQLAESLEQERVRTEEVGSASGALASMASTLKGAVAIIQREAQQLSASMAQMSAGVEESVKENEGIVVTIAGVDAKLQENRAGMEAYGRWEEEDARPMREGLLEVTGRMAETAREIGALSDMMTSIADETRFLALNARLEAARMAEAGGGFGVVSESMRRLSHDVTAGTEEIAKLVRRVVDGGEGFQGRVKGYAADAEREARRFADTLEALRGVAERVGSIRETVELVSAASGQQAESISALSTSARRLEGSVGQLNEAVAELERLAKGLEAVLAEAA